MKAMKHYLTPPLPTEAVYYTQKWVISEIELKSIIGNLEYNHGNKTINNHGKENIRKESNSKTI